MTAAIYYHPGGYTTDGPKLMGRNAAGESFLRGFLMHSSGNEFCAQVDGPEHGQQFAATVNRYRPSASVQIILRTNLGRLVEAGVLYYPSPIIGELAFQRARYGHDAWSLCGITHTTASSSVMDGIASFLTAPIQPWDAVICTSPSVQDNVKRIIAAQEGYLKDRLGIARTLLPQLPVIPLGVDTESFVFNEDNKTRSRLELGIGSEEIIVLFMGRLSFHAKAHPLAMYQALEVAAKETSKSVVLIECGWHANEFIAKAFADAARLVCPSIRVLTLDGRKPEARQNAWAAADIFCSLSDNIQETFGITPVEAMSAGLPVVVSDWDGYKSTIRHKIDGFLIPTIMPKGGLGNDLAFRHALEIDNYDRYIGLICSLVAVDIPATVEAFKQLFLSEDLRRRMGQAGQIRAKTEFDWSVIIRQYEDLWSSLDDIRKSQSKNLTRLSSPWPARMDPFQAFESYPTKLLTSNTVVRLVGDDVERALQRSQSLKALAMVDYAKMVLPSEKETRAILAALARDPRSAKEVIEAIPSDRKLAVFRSLSWLIKIGILSASFDDEQAHEKI